ncbi:hypothetical protein Tcan_00694, partial [Toxocara canis]
MKRIVILFLSLCELTNTLECWSGVEWISFGRPMFSDYTSKQCYSSTLFCVTIHAKSSEVYGFEKGCDQELPGLYGVAQCLSAGCRDESNGQVCCCKGNNCNLAALPYLSLYCCLITIFVSSFVLL